MRDVSSVEKYPNGPRGEGHGGTGQLPGPHAGRWFCRRLRTNGQALRKLLEWAHRRLNGCQPQLVVGQVDNTTNQQSHRSTYNK